jgi:hypothetical protein
VLVPSHSAKDMVAETYMQKHNGNGLFAGLTIQDRLPTQAIAAQMIQLQTSKRVLSRA